MGTNRAVHGGKLNSILVVKSHKPFWKIVRERQNPNIYMMSYIRYGQPTNGDSLVIVFAHCLCS